jgi:hypothetical protein
MSTTEKFTNKELFEELKNRGFFVFPSEIKGGQEPNCITVSVERPEKDIYITWQANWDSENRGSGSDVAPKSES